MGEAGNQTREHMRVAELDTALAGAQPDAPREALRVFVGDSPRAQRALVVILDALANGEKIPRGVSLIDFQRQSSTPAERKRARSLAPVAREILRRRAQKSGAVT